MKKFTIEVKGASSAQLLTIAAELKIMSNDWAKHGTGTAPQWDTVRKGLDWFRRYFAKEYMVLLD